VSFDTRAQADRVVAALRDTLGLDRLRCLHVNDAEVGLGSNRDRHTTLGKGTIGKGMATFLGHPAFQGLPAILETPDADGSYADELRILRRLHKKGLAAA
jgi:deoxyribonuclease-4